MHFGAAAPGDSQENGHDTIPAQVSRQLFDELIGWIALNTSYDLLRAYRVPATMSFCEIDRVVPYQGTDLIVEKGLLAAYDVSRRHIFLVRPWSPLDRFDQSVLLHEMIHDVQLGNRDWNCVGEPELEAYLLQDRWLVERGIHHGFDWGMIHEWSDCSNSD